MSIPKTEIEAAFFTHNLLWSVCSQQLSAAGSDPAAAFNFRLVAMILAFFTFEAYLNQLGQLLLPRLWKRERDLFRSDGTFSKLDLLSEVCGVSFETNKRPYQTLRDLQGLRDLIAHGRPEHSAARVKIRSGTLPSVPSLIGKLVTPTKAQRATEDVRCVIERLNLAAHTLFPNRVVAKDGLDLSLGEYTWSSASQPNPRMQRTRGERA